MKMYFKWELKLFPDENSKLKYDESDVISIISSEIYYTESECYEAASTFDMDFPCSYGGPEMVIHKSDNIQEMELLEANE